MNDWISVNDKLPELGISVLTCAVSKITPECEDSHSMYVAWIDKFGLENKPIWQYSWCCGCYCQERVTHWKPLPEYPKC